MKSDIGLIGLGVMGENLALNIESKNFTVALFNKTTAVVTKFIDGRGKGKKFVGCNNLAELVNNVSIPRKILIMVKSGNPVDQIIEQILPLLSEGDVLIDGGNTYYEDTIRRLNKVESFGCHYIGSGVSGGEEGALKGPSLMPGGSKEAWDLIEPIFSKIAANVDEEACCKYMGLGGSGHYVKMVHNGIEYGDMQLIAETYYILKNVLKQSNDEIAQIFSKWNKGELNSYLIEITAEILKTKDKDGNFLLDKILDVAGQKGTGKWMSIDALNEGVSLTLITNAVFARFISVLKDERVKASKLFVNSDDFKVDNISEAIEDIKSALYVSKIISYAQGFIQLKEIEKKHQWGMNFANIASVWRGGCIIRSQFLNNIKNAYLKNPTLDCLLLDDFFTKEIKESEKGLRRTVALCALSGVPSPAIYSALAFFDSYRCDYLPTNLIQAQRDYFGAHQYERVDKPRGKFEHFNWTGTGGDTASSVYNK